MQNTTKTHRDDCKFSRFQNSYNESCECPDAGAAKINVTLSAFEGDWGTDLDVDAAYSRFVREALAVDHPDAEIEVSTAQSLTRAHVYPLTQDNDRLAEEITQACKSTLWDAFCLSPAARQ